MGLRGRRESDEHREFEDMAVAHVVGGLTVDQGRMFRSHLLECTSCRARVGELRAIAHDLADVERDERRLRTAKRTETKSHDGDDAEVAVAPTPRIGGRATLLIAAGLTILMALSAWNFVLRGRLQQSQEAVSMMRESVTVLRDGQAWETVQSESGAAGQVSVLDDEQLVLVVDNLEQARYGIYLLDAQGKTLHRAEAEATNSMLYVYLDDPIVPNAASVVVTDPGSEELTMAPGGGTVFEARRPETDTEGAEIRVTPVDEVVEPSG